MLAVARERPAGGTARPGRRPRAPVRGRQLRPRAQRPLLRSPRRDATGDLPAPGTTGRGRARAGRRLARSLGRERAVGAARPRGRVDAGRSTSAGSPPRSSCPKSVETARCSSPATGSWSFARGEPRPLAGRPPAPKPSLPPVPRGRLPDRATARPRGPRRPARVPLRARAGTRRGGDRAPLAGSRRTDAPTLARARRGGVLRALLLRVGHPVLSRPEHERPRRPQGDQGRGGALRGRGATQSCGCSRPALVVTVGAVAAQRLLGIGRLTDAVGKSFLLRGRGGGAPPHPSGASGWLNERDEPSPARQGTHPGRRELAAL